MPPTTIQQAMQTALRHHQAGRLPQAEAIYREILGREPGNADALHLLGVIALQKGRHQDAIGLIRQAIAANPAMPQSHLNLGKALRESGRLDEALAVYREAVRLQPGLAVAHHSLGRALREKGLTEAAAGAFRRAIELQGDFAEAYSSLGNVLQQVGRIEEAVAAYQKAIQVKPGFAEGHYNLGLALRGEDDTAGAISAFREAVRIKPDFAQAHHNLGNALRESARYEEALAACDLAIRCKPDHAGAHLNKAVILLLRGRLAEGWAEYRWRWQTSDIQPNRRAFPQPEWNGEALSGRAVLLHAEQGFGDTIQFMRYAPLLARRGVRVIVEVPQELKGLLRGVEGVRQLLGAGDPLPAFDCHAALLDLPGIFGTTLQTVPANVPYLRPEPALADLWRSRLAPRLKVGLVWAGRPQHHNDRNRSLPLSSLAPLAQVKGVVFYSLQKGAAAAQAQNPPPGMELVDLSQEIKDFADTAALIENLDLVISVDTVVAHLAGALAKPVWTLLPLTPDWRWLLAREDSPWYPTMRLFRQGARGEWGSVIERVARELKARA